MRSSCTIRQSQKISPRRRPLPWTAEILSAIYLYPQTQFGEDRVGLVHFIWCISGRSNRLQLRVVESLGSPLLLP